MQQAAVANYPAKARGALHQLPAAWAHESTTTTCSFRPGLYSGQSTLSYTPYHPATAIFTMSTSIEAETLQQYLADSPPTIVPLAIKPHFEALSDKEKLYAHHLSV